LFAFVGADYYQFRRGEGHKPFDVRPASSASS
jgi:hypothetical protein